MVYPRSADQYPGGAKAWIILAEVVQNPLSTPMAVLQAFGKFDGANRSVVSLDFDNGSKSGFVGEDMASTNPESRHFSRVLDEGSTGEM